MSIPANRGPRRAVVDRVAAPAIVAAIFTIGAALASGGCGPSDADTPAVETIRGRWTTAAREYRDRSLEITDGEVVFGTGGGGSARHRILDVQAAPETSAWQKASRVSTRTTKLSGNAPASWASSRAADAGSSSRQSIRIRN